MFIEDEKRIFPAGLTTEQKNRKDVDLYDYLRAAWDESTRENNRFREAVKRVGWDNFYIADGEYVMEYGDASLSTPSMDPFAEDIYPPCFCFADCFAGSFTDMPFVRYIYFE